MFDGDQLDVPLDLSQLSQNGRILRDMDVMNEYVKPPPVELKVPDVQQKLR